MADRVPTAEIQSGLQLEPFKLERFFDQYEFSTRHLLCCSDCEPLRLQELLALADPDSLQRWSNLTLAYTEVAGLPALRAEIAGLYSRIQPDDVLVLVPEEGVFLSSLALLSPGDHMICTFPGYQSLYEVAKAVGAEVDHWEVSTTADGQLGFDVDKLAGLVRSNTKLITVNFPHNPTGVLPSKADWARIVETCRSAGAWLFSDEMYRLLELDEADRLPSAADCYERSIVLSGVSKTIGLPGLRIGWLASQDAGMLKKIRSLKDYTTICNSAPSEVLALMGLRARDTLLRRNRDIITSNLALVHSFFEARKDMFRWHPPSASSICFPQLITGEPIEDFCKRLVQEAGVLLLPATVYDHPDSVAAGHFRLGLGRRDLPGALKALQAYLDSSRAKV